MRKHFETNNGALQTARKRCNKIAHDLNSRTSMMWTMTRGNDSARQRGADTPDALSQAASAIFAVLERTAASDAEEMRIVESAEPLIHPQRKFDCIAISL